MRIEAGEKIDITRVGGYGMHRVRCFVMMRYLSVNAFDVDVLNECASLLHFTYLSWLTGSNEW
jgi:hypothetical protein